MAERRTLLWSVRQLKSKRAAVAYRNICVLESFCESGKYGILMLLFDNARSCGENPESILALPDLVRDAKGEEHPQNLRPLFLYKRSVWRRIGY
jgi:hypothetical protein